MAPPKAHGEAMVPFKERDLLKTTSPTPVRLALPVALLAVAAATASAQQPLSSQSSQQPPQQREHVVRRGDTLWDLARTYLDNPFHWPRIFEANRQVVEDPHWIYPAERLIIPPILQAPLAQYPITGHPALPPVSPPASAEAGPTPATANAAAAAAPAPAVDLRRPVVSAGEYVTLPWLSSQPEAALVGRIRAKADPAADGERMPPALYPHERVHVAVTGAAVAGDGLLVVRAGRRVGMAGRIVEPLAILRVESVTGGVAVARVVSQFGDARVGDDVMRMTPVPAIGTGPAEAVSSGLPGLLLEFLSVEPLYGTTDLAFLSVGAADGVGIGDEFAVYVPATSGAPAEQVGVVRVVRAEGRSSTARVVSVSSTALQGGLPVHLIRKMP
jgi:hypothetical protein